MVIPSWPETSFVQGLHQVFLAVGFCHSDSGSVWQAKPGSLCSLANALSDAVADAHEPLPRLRESVDSCVVLQAGNRQASVTQARVGTRWSDNPVRFASSAALS